MTGMEAAIGRLLELTATLDLRTAAVILAVCFMGEAVIGIPYVLESAWLLIGYQAGRGALSPFSLLGFWLAGQLGRQLGAVALYQVTRVGSAPVLKLWRKLSLSDVLARKAADSRMLRRINVFSPFSVALGRLCALRIPLTLTLAMKKKRKTLALAVLCSSLVWDGVYISLGATVGSTTTLKPAQMFALSIAGLTVMYLSVFVFRRVFGRAERAGPPAAPG
ncbi:MAG: hypothetical protein HY673_08380 [Chloroflexi bacterium]|nr:hypothetical protein [Chloroflexota bacterium]